MQKGFVYYELLIVLGIIGIMAVMIVFVLTRPMTNPHLRARSQCVNNLKQVSLAYKIWENEHGDKFPMAVSTAKGGAMGFDTGADVFRQYQVMSNQLSTPLVLICPADTRKTAAGFAQLKNQNVSYFVGLDARDKYPNMLLSGDRNIIGPTKPENGVLQLRPGDAASWTAAVHVNQGNAGLSDGSVQMWSNTDLQKALQNFSPATNVWRLALPE
jgi:type II secretory pathway pseudopilin PulG